MIKSVNIKCNDNEMKEILDFIVTTNKYQLPKEVVFTIKEDKPKFLFFKKRYRTSKTIEDKQAKEESTSTNNNPDEPVVDVEFTEETVTEEEHNNENMKDTEKEGNDNMECNSNEDVEERDITDIMNRLELIEKTLKKSEKVRGDLEKAIKNLRKEKEDMLEENKKLAESRNEILTILKENVESIEDQKLQDQIIKLYFTEVKPED